MSAQDVLPALRALAAFAMVLAVASCSAAAAPASLSTQPSAAASTAPATPTASESATADPSASSSASADATEAAGAAAELNFKPVADYSVPSLAGAFADCSIIADTPEQVLWSCEADGFGVELTPTTVSLIVPDAETAAPSTTKRFAAAVAEAIGINDRGSGLHAAITALAGAQAEAPGSAAPIEVAPGWIVAITALADGAVGFIADGSAT